MHIYINYVLSTYIIFLCMLCFCDFNFPADEKDDLLHDINTYRKVLNLPELKELGKMSCLADEIADDLDDQYNKCEDFVDDSKIPDIQDNLKKCKINMNTTKDGVIMPVCVPNLDHDALLSNYTKSNRFTMYLNNSKYTVAGVGSDDDWMVLVISTNTSSGDFSSATSLLAGANWKGHWLVLAFFLSALIVLIN